MAALTLPISTNANLHDILLNIGMPPHLYGYSYVVYSMELILQDPSYLHSVTKGLYIDVARHFNATPQRVERAIRNAINNAWLHGNMDFIGHVFKNCVRPDKGVPTNSLFLARLYYYITNREQ